MIINKILPDQEGECKFGANCSFSHTDKDRRTTEENAELIELRKNINGMYYILLLNAFLWLVATPLEASKVT